MQGDKEQDPKELAEDGQARLDEVISGIISERDCKRSRAVCNNGKAVPVRETSVNLEMTCPDDVGEEETPWLIEEYIPRNQITVLAGDGGVGKTSIWCAIVSAVTTGKIPFMLEGSIPEEFAAKEPGEVLYFSAEEELKYRLKRMLRKNGACMKRIHTIEVGDDRFSNVKFNSPFLEQLIAKYRPVLCVFDPIQAFIPPEIHMGERNAMRSCTAPLIGYGEKYGTASLITVHTNKQSGVWGRKRIADSADIWDISRSVLIAGETNEKGIRYLSHEKCNCAPLGETVLFSIEDEAIRFKGYTERRDRDFVSAADYSVRQAPQREEAKEFILDFLKDGEEHEISDLEETAKIMGMSKNSMRNAKADLKQAGKIKVWSIGFNPKKYLISLIAS